MEKCQGWPWRRKLGYGKNWDMNRKKFMERGLENQKCSATKLQRAEAKNKKLDHEGLRHWWPRIPRQGKLGQPIHPRSPWSCSDSSPSPSSPAPPASASSSPSACSADPPASAGSTASWSCPPASPSSRGTFRWVSCTSTENRTGRVQARRSLVCKKRGV